MKIEAANLKGTPYAGVRFYFVNVTPALAREWLEHNKRNRKVKRATVEAYKRDIHAEEWLTNHQGMAFDENDNMIDGQHRLEAIAGGIKTVMLVVSTGWPVKPAKTRSVTMDTVDRGCVRSIKDQLELSHGIKDASLLVKLCGPVAICILGTLDRVARLTPASALAITDIFAGEFEWLADNQSKQEGIRNSQAGAVMLLGLAAWPDKTKAFYAQFRDGLEMKATSPAYHLRNFVTSGTKLGAAERRKLRNAAAHHLKLFVDGKTCGGVVVNSEEALNALVQACGPKAEAVRKLFSAEGIGAKFVADQKVTPVSDEHLLLFRDKLNDDFATDEVENLFKGDKGGANAFLTSLLRSRMCRSRGFRRYEKSAEWSSASRNKKLFNMLPKAGK